MRNKPSSAKERKQIGRVSKLLKKCTDALHSVGTTLQEVSNGMRAMSDAIERGCLEAKQFTLEVQNDIEENRERV